jgi:hypothetical protein
MMKGNRHKAWPLVRKNAVALILLSIPAVVLGAQTATLVPTFRLVPPAQVVLYTKLKASLSPAIRARLLSVEPGIQSQLSASPSADPTKAATSGISTAFPTFSADQTTALAFIVLMDATKDCDQDLQSALIRLDSNEITPSHNTSLTQQVSGAENIPIRGIDATPDPLASFFASLPKLPSGTQGATYYNVELSGTGSLTYQDLRPIQTNLQGELDSMNEESEMTGMRLEMAMERRSKLLDSTRDMAEQLSPKQDEIVNQLKN